MIDWWAVEIKDEHEAALRAYILHGPEAWLPLQSRLAETQVAAPYVQLVQAAFGVAVKRRFSPAYTIDEIIRFVADVRLELMETGEDVNPRVCENLIRLSLGHLSPSTEAAPDNERAVQQETAARVAMLFFLIPDAQPSEVWLDEFVRESADVARHWIAEMRAGQAAGPTPAG